MATASFVRPLSSSSEPFSFLWFRFYFVLQYIHINGNQSDEIAGARRFIWRIHIHIWKLAFVFFISFLFFLFSVFFVWNGRWSFVILRDVKLHLIGIADRREALANKIDCAMPMWNREVVGLLFSFKCIGCSRTGLWVDGRTNGRVLIKF